MNELNKDVIKDILEAKTRLQTAKPAVYYIHERSLRSACRVSELDYEEQKTNLEWIGWVIIREICSICENGGNCKDGCLSLDFGKTDIP